jgi:two-component system cell cycle response regulator
MIHLANILIATDDSALGQELLDKIRRHGYDGRVVASQQDVLAAAREDRPDVILIGSTIADGDPIVLGKALKNMPETVEAPLALIASVRSPELKAKAFAAGIDDVLSPPLDDVKLQARLRPLVRLSTIQGELHLRAKTARRFGIELTENLPRPSVDDRYPLLLVGPGGPDIAPMFAGAKTSFAADPFIADDLLGSHHFDAAVLLPDSNPSPYLDLCAQTRNNPRLFNLPVLVVTKPDHVAEDIAYHHGASGFFTMPADPHELETAVLSLVRRQRLRWSIRDAIGKAMQPATRDTATGMFNRAFLDSYLEDRVGFATRHGRHLSISFFRVPDIENIRTHFGEEQADHLRLQVGQWISGLLRGEDLTARFDENEFCVVLPDTPKEEADIVVHRIAGVLAYTDFAVVEVYQPIKVWVRVGAAELVADDTAASLVERARRDIAS